MLKFSDGVLVDLTPDEEDAIKAILKKHEAKEAIKQLEPNEFYEVMAKALINTVDIPDKTSLKMKKYYPTFEEIIGTGVAAGFKFTYKGELWKVRQLHTVQDIYKPGIDTASLSLYERINETNSGSKEDPIPYNSTITVYEGMYYSYENKLYLCIRDSGQPLYTTPDTLLNNYFQLVSE